MALSTKPNHENSDQCMHAAPASWRPAACGLDRTEAGTGNSLLQDIQSDDEDAESCTSSPSGLFHTSREPVYTDDPTIMEWPKKSGNESVFMVSKFPSDTFTGRGGKEWRRLVSGRHGRRLRRILHNGNGEHQRPLQDLIRPRLTHVTKRIESITPGQVVLEGGIPLKSRKLAKVLADSRRAVCFVATIGHELDRKVANLSSTGRCADEYLLDRVGSLTIEEFVQAFQRETAQRLLRNGQTPTIRFSPGYCDWPLAEQKKMFALVDATGIGVSLTQTLLMRPRKSVSGIFGILERTNGRMPEIYNPCESCNRSNCLERRTAQSLPFDGKQDLRFTA